MDAPSAHLPTRHGDFEVKVFHGAGALEHIALIKGVPVDDCLVRVHSECATGDIFSSLRCDCRDQLKLSLKVIEEAGCGVVIYLRGHEGRGIGLANKIRAYALQDKGLDTVDANLSLGFAADARDYAAAVGILRSLKLRKFQLLTNNLAKVDALTRAGFTISKRVPLWTTTNPHNTAYIATKRDKMGHVEADDQDEV